MRAQIHCTLLMVLMLALPALAQSRELIGVVTDPAGNAVVRATVRDSAGHVARSDQLGRFLLEDAEGELTVSAPGFATERVPITAGINGETLRIRMAIARPEELVSVSAASESLPPATTTFNAEMLRQSPTFSLDEALRASPGFSLFRRAPSWSANPTTQGVSLQGTGSSAASRALVLEDGVPLNDPFGGWVYWQRIPVTAPERVELQTGSGSGLYGSDAIGGAISIVTPRPLASRGVHEAVDFSYGNLNTPSGSASVVGTRGPWAGSVAVFGASTNGYIPVPLELRGAADYYASSTNAGTALRVDRRITSKATAFVGGFLYGESRQNGTHLQMNGATLRELRTGADVNDTKIGSVAARVYGGTETLRQTFTAISADRNTELLTRKQGVPANQAGGSLRWSRPLKARQLLVAGFDLRYVEGESDEYAYQAGFVTSYLRNGGVQVRYGAFVEDRVRVSQRLLVTVSARVDHWSDMDARSIVVPLGTQSAAGVRTTLPGHSAVAFDPRIAVSYAMNAQWTVSASGARAFRTPTLNELYRSFRVGNVFTLANPTLRDEHSTTVQGSVLYAPNSTTSFRATGFWNGINAPVSNVTLSSTPALITRKRENLGSLRAAGMEAAASVRFKDLRLDGAYQYAHSTVTSFSADPTLVGLWIPQVPRHSSSLRATYVRKLWTAVLDGRYFGQQFDDDRNQFPLSGAFVMNAGISRTLPKGWIAYVAVDNLLDRRYAVARTPTLSTAPPTLGRVGVRWESRER